MRAMRELGELANSAVSEASDLCVNTMIGINSGIRMLSLSALALHASTDKSAMTSVVDTVGEYWRIVQSDLVLMLNNRPSFQSLLVKQSPGTCTSATAGS